MSDQHADYVVQRELSEWLLVHGYAEEKRGYGHVSADDLSEALLAKFDVRLRQSDGEVRP